ncbi:MAG: tetratricopeptide repeat protein [Bellilinea sp.]
MVTISLRAYNKEIDAMIDNGEVKEAVAHCRHILRIYPKHIETYRLLGKAYLETQRFTEAADVLQRVLSSLPDDFISQIGMSMIREDEGNLDAAIYHMERAFEAQPSNTAVQDELKRLYGRRDGVIPAKIRLTRGALVRMYARGDLYQQAIAEARVGLAEQPDRVDLEVILARMYFLAGQKVPATEVSSRLVEKLPYCLEANKILAEVLPDTSRAEDADIYKQRIFALDPYLAYLPAGSESSTDAPEETVMVEKFEGELEEEAETQPDWAQVAGVQLEQPEEEETLPDWLTSVETQEQPSEVTPIEEVAPEKDWGKIEIETSPEDIVPVEEPENPEEELPDWMRAAGWQAASGDVLEEAPDEEQINEVAEELAANEAEIPDWLQEIAPGEETEPLTEEAEEPTDGEDNAWLDSIFANAEQKAGTLSDLELTSLEEIPDLNEPTEAGVELPDLAGEEDFAKAEEPEPLSSDAQELPDWLTSLASVDEPAEEPVATTATPSDDDDWLDILQPKDEGAAEEGLEALQPAETVESEDFTLPTFTDGQELEVPEKISEHFATEHSVEPSLELEDFFAEAEKENPPESDATQPTRVHTPEFEAAAFAPAFQDFGAETKPDEEVEPFSAESAFTEHPEDLTEGAVPALLGEDDFLEFGLSAQTGENQDESTAEALTVGEEESEEVAVPDWLMESLDKEVGEKEYEASETVLEEPITADTEPIAEVGEEVAVTDNLDETMDDDTAFAWLEALAARQGADEDSLQVAAEDRVEETPEWIKSEIEKHEFEPEIPVEEPEESLEPEPANDLTQTSPMEVGEIEGTGEEVIFSPTLEETPAEEVEPPVLTAEEPVTTPGVTEPVSAEPTHEELPDWLKETLETEQEEPKEEIEQAPEPRIFRRVSEWVADEAVETPAEIEPQAEIMPELNAEPEPEAEIQIIPEKPAEIEPPVGPLEAPVEPTAPEEDTEVEAVPEWLQDLTLEHPRKVTGMLVNAETPPDWLKELESEGTKVPPEELPYAAPAEPAAWMAEQEEISKSEAVDDTSPLHPGPSPVATPASSSSDLYNAQAALNRQEIVGALEYYNKLISRGEALEDTIHDLRDALYRYPIDISIWQALGDAYARGNQLQEALDAYTKAEELLR